LHYYVGAGRVERALRGVFRLVHFPATDHEELVPVWLWSGGEGVFGLETALAIHGLSDTMPSKHDLVVPSRWRTRRVRPPRGIRLVIDDIPRTDREWIGPIPITKPARTLRDCIKHHVSPELVEQAIVQAVRRRIVSRADVRAMKREAS
jgi:predicted transcriptional regulator of viral defense system